MTLLIVSNKNIFQAPKEEFKLWMKIDAWLYEVYGREQYTFVAPSDGALYSLLLEDKTLP
jgi:hypothetical protein